MRWWWVRHTGPRELRVFSHRVPSQRLRLRTRAKVPHVCSFTRSTQLAMHTRCRFTHFLPKPMSLNNIVSLYFSSFKKYAVRDWKLWKQCIACIFDNHPGINQGCVLINSDWLNEVLTNNTYKPGLCFKTNMLTSGGIKNFRIICHHTPICSLRLICVLLSETIKWGMGM